MEMGDAGKEKRRGSAEVDCGLWDKGPEPVSVTRLGRIFFRPDQTRESIWDRELKPPSGTPNTVRIMGTGPSERRVTEKYRDGR
jgi:hypothetical protein